MLRVAGCRVMLQGWDRLYRPTMAALATVILAVGLYLVMIGFTERNWGLVLGFDRAIYMDGAQRWLHGGPFYLERQLGGPYDIQEGDLLYPPTVLWMLVPFSYLPPILWWVLPLGFIAWCTWSWHPKAWSWPLMAACLAWPNTTVAFVTGYPGLWIAAAIAAGLRWRWPGALVLLKPSLLPFAAIGIRTRGWWLTAGVLVVLTLPFLSLLPVWLRVVFDGRGWGGWLYSLREVPLMLLPVAAWGGRQVAGPSGPATAEIRETAG